MPWEKRTVVAIFACLMSAILWMLGGMLLGALGLCGFAAAFAVPVFLFGVAVLLMIAYILMTL